MTRWWSWAVMALVLVVALGVGAAGDRAPRTESERIDVIAGKVRCPTCESLSAAESDAAAAQAVRDEIRTRLRDGQGEGEILAFLASRYGDDILLEPDRTGVAGLVWLLPVVAVAAAGAGVMMAFGRWRRQAAGAGPTADDRRLVEEAMRS